MQLQEDDFPMYQLVMRNRPSYAPHLEATFKRAQVGNDNDKLFFARDILDLVQIDLRPELIALQLMEGETLEIHEKTLKSSIALLEDLSGRGLMGAKRMLDELENRGCTFERDKPDPLPSAPAPAQAPAVPPAARKIKKKSFSI